MAIVFMPLVVFCLFFIISSIVTSIIAQPQVNQSNADNHETIITGAYTIEISVPESIVIDSFNLSNATLSTQNATIIVTTDNPDGYDLAVNMTTDELCLRAARDYFSDTPCSGIASTDKFQAVDPLTETHNIGIGFWGASLPPYTIWNPIPASTDTPWLLKSSPSPVTSDSTILRIGARADYSTTAATYAGKAVFSLLGTMPPPVVITDINPSSGSLGETVTIAGANFTYNSAPLLLQVLFGENPCDNLSVINDTSATCDVPAGSGIVGISYTNIYHELESSGLIFTYAEQLPTTFSEFTASHCTRLMDVGDTVILTDTRDGTDYRVRKMPDGFCWMVDNLKYASPTATMISFGATSSNSVQQYIDPSASTYCSGLAGDSLTKCGYLYNWLATTNGTGTAGMTSGDASGNICPGDSFGLPKNSEYQGLIDAMEGLYPWPDMSAWNPGGLWEAVTPGYYYSPWGNNLYNLEGIYGQYWSSTAASSSEAYSFVYSSNPSDNWVGASYADGDSQKSRALGVRCKTSYPTTNELNGTIGGWYYYDNPYNPFTSLNGHHLDTVSGLFSGTVNGSTYMNEPVLYNPSSAPWGLSTTNIASSRGIADEVFMLVQGGNIPATITMLGSPSYRTANIANLVNMATTWGLDGIDIDYEPWWHASMSQTVWNNYVLFVSELRVATQSAGLILQVTLPLQTTTPNASYVNFSDIIDITDRLALMAYDHMYSVGCGTPLAPYSWIFAGVTHVISSVGRQNIDKIIVALPSYGYSCTNMDVNTGVNDVIATDKPWFVSQPGYSSATRDPDSGEMMWTQSGRKYVYNDTESLDAKRHLVEGMGIKGVFVWQIGGNDWFTVDRTQMMQSFNGCGTMPVGSIVILTDARDGQNYRVRKMEDGKCWMITNLKLGNINSALALTPSDTNITNNWSLPRVNASGSPSTTSYYDQPMVDARVDTVGQYSLSTDITSDNFYGYYYNWCAATAGGTASGGGNTCTAGGTQPTNATTDICPAGWRLPRGNDVSPTNDFAILNASMNAGAPAAAALNNWYSNWVWSGNKFYGVFAGFRDGSSWNPVASNAGYWTSSATSSANVAYDMYLSSAMVSAGDSSYNRGHRLSVRCLQP